MAKVSKDLALLVVGLSVVGASWVTAAPTGDAARGKTKFDAACAECHSASDLKGAASAEFRSQLQQIVAGKAKHRPKLSLTAEEVADLDSYLATLK